MAPLLLLCLLLAPLTTLAANVTVTTYMTPDCSGKGTEASFFNFSVTYLSNHLISVCPSSKLQLLSNMSTAPTLQVFGGSDVCIQGSASGGSVRLHCWTSGFEIIPFMLGIFVMLFALMLLLFIMMVIAVRQGWLRKLPPSLAGRSSLIPGQNQPVGEDVHLDH